MNILLKPINMRNLKIEAQKLRKYCNQTGRPAMDVIRELIQGLPVRPGIASAPHLHECSRWLFLATGTVSHAGG